MDASFEAVVRLIADEVSDRIGLARDSGGPAGAIPVGVSARHAHLSRADVDALFGPGYRLVKAKDLSQPGQFACEERVAIASRKGKALEGLRVLGPERARTQVELSASDARALGVEAPLRESGDLDGSAPVTVIGPRGSVCLAEGAIVARRHIHFSPADAARFGVSDRDVVSVAVGGPRGGSLDGVVCRVSPDYALDMHVDTDEANALGLGPGATASIVGKEARRG